jgi:Ca2+-binding RTX toxin-like protein
MAVIIGTDGPDVLAAGAAGDVVRGLGGNDTLSSAFDRTRLFGDGGRDSLSTAFALTIDLVQFPGTAFSTDAVLNGGGGGDTLDADVAVTGIDARFETDIDLSLETRLIGAVGDDRIEANVSLDHRGSDFGRAVAAATLSGDDGDDILITNVTTFSSIFSAGQAIAHLSGGAGADTLFAMTRANGIETGSCEIRLFGGVGNDVLTSEATARGDRVSATNEVFGGAGADQLFATTSASGESGSGRARLDGGSGNDVLVSRLFGDGSSTLLGVEGDDRLEADVAIAAFGRVATEIDGGSGDDRVTAIVSSPDPLFTEAISTLRGGIGNDFLEVSASANAIQGTVSGGTGNDTLLASATGSESLAGAAWNALNGGTGNDVLLATADPESPASPGTVLNHLLGAEGNDTLIASIGFSSPGTSILFGGPGDDRLTTQGGDSNELTGGAGDDLLTGAAGNDVFVYRGPNTGSDVITNFAAGDGVSEQDLIRLVGYGITDISQLSIDASTGQTIVSGFGTGRVILLGVSASLLSNDDFVFA